MVREKKKSYACFKLVLWFIISFTLNNKTMVTKSVLVLWYLNEIIFIFTNIKDLSAVVNEFA